MAATQPERLVDIIGAMVHGGVNARRALSRGLIITYMAPEPETPRERERWFLSAARLNYWPDEPELKIVLDCLHREWRTHPAALVYETGEWTRREVQARQGILGTFDIYWRQWPIRTVFSAPAALQEVLRAAL